MLTVTAAFIIQGYLSCGQRKDRDSKKICRLKIKRGGDRQKGQGDEAMYKLFTHENKKVKMPSPAPWCPSMGEKLLAGDGQGLFEMPA